MLAIITNLLEPVCYVIYLLAFLVQFLKTGKSPAGVAATFYLFATLIMWHASSLAHQGQQNFFIYNYFLLPASVLFFCAYFRMILHTPARKNIVLILFSFNALVLILKSLLLPLPHLFDSIGFADLSISIVILSFLFFRQQLKEVSETSIFANFNFWVVCGYFISFSGSFLVFLTYYYLTQEISGDYVYKNRYLLTLLWGIPNILLFVGSLITLTGSLWTNYHKRS